MRVVITGGAGFIGRAIVERLAKRGDEVVALVRDAGRARFLKDEAGRVSLREERPLERGPADRADEGRGGRDPRRRARTRSGSSPASATRCGTRTSVRPSACSMRPSPPALQRIVYVSTANVFGDTTWPAGRRDVQTRREARLHLVVRRNQVPGTPGRGDAHQERRADRDRHAHPGLRPERSLAGEPAPRRRVPRQAADSAVS